jgi:hypothetical protein
MFKIELNYKLVYSHLIILHFNKRKRTGLETKETTKIKKDLVKRVNLIILKTKRVEISMIIEDKDHKDQKDQKVKDLDITMEGTAATAKGIT